MKRHYTTIMLMGLLVLAACPASACLVPVFRYAMERWAADYYEAVLIHRGQLEEDQKQLLKELRQEDSETDAFLNLRILEADITATTDEKVKGLLMSEELPETLPVLALWYPWHRGRTPPVWMGELTSSTVAALVQPPVRRQLVQHLIEGQSAVWVFVESGDADKDKAARQLLGRELEAATQELKEMAPPPIDEFAGPELSYEFSILVLSRADPKEQMLLVMLLNSEPDLHEYADEPMAFPVFGRGRVLCALVGAGIRADNIREIVAFLTGPCGCQIKAMNPGIDLLMAANWDAAVMEFYETDYLLPELTGVMPEAPVKPADTNAVTPADTNAVMPADTNAVTTADTNPVEPADANPVKPGAQEQKLRGLGVMATTTVMLVVIGLVVALGTLAVSWRRRAQL
ncbi:hypothetical protein ES703_35012 [subsurface metagenome]